MNATRSSKIPNEAWEERKDVIIELFRNEKKPLKGRHGVIETMKARHNFIASVSQYEARLRKWKVRKNLTKEEWMSIGQIVMERERQGIGSEVWIFGVQVPHKKLKKEISRNGGIDQSITNIIGGTEHRLPDGVVIEAPRRGGITENIASSSLPAGSRTSHEVTNDVDRISVNSMSGVGAPSEGAEKRGWSSLRIDSAMNTDGFCMEGTGSHSVLAGQVEGSRALEYYSPPISPSELLVAGYPGITNTTLKSNSAFFLEPYNHFPASSDTTVLESELRYSDRIKSQVPTDSSVYLLASLKSSNQFLTKLSVPANNFDNAIYLRLLSSTLPSRTIDNFLKIPLQETILVVAVSQIINKTFLPHFLGYDKGHDERELDPLRVVLLRLQNSTDAAIGRFCACLPGAYEDSLREGLFAIAVQWGASKVVEGVLSTAKHGRKTIESFEHLGFVGSAFAVAIGNQDVQSAMSIAAYFGDFETVSEDMLRCTPVPKPWATPLAMDLMTGFHAKGSPTPDFIVEAIFKSGDFPSIQKAICNASNPKEITYAQWIAQCGVINAIIDNVNIVHQVSLFETILPYIDRVDFDKLPYMPDSYRTRPEMNRNLSRAMALAAISHQEKLMHVFRRHGITPSAADLCESVLMRDAAAIKALIEAGADVTGTTSALTPHLHVHGVKLRRSFGTTTPYAEAIRTKSTSIINIFESHVPQPHLAPLSYALSIIIAASEVGDDRLLSEYLPSILKDTDEFTNDEVLALDQALSLALVGNHEDIISRLSKIGFDEKMSRIGPGLDSLKIAILSRNKAHISTVLGCREYVSAADVVPAITIGDTDSVRLLLNFVKPFHVPVQELLFSAVEANHYEIVEVLLDHSVTSSCGDDRTLEATTVRPVWQRSRGSPRSIRGLIKTQHPQRTWPYAAEGAHNRGDTPLTRAFRNGNSRMVDLLLRKGAPPNSSRGRLHGSNRQCYVSALQVAAELGDVSAIEKFLQYGADPWDSDALANATYMQDMACVQALLSASSSMVDTERRRYSIHALVVSIYLGNIELVELLSQYADINQITHVSRIDGHTHLNHCSAFGASIRTKGPLDILRILLDRGASLEGVCSYKDVDLDIQDPITPLLEAVSTGCVDRVKVLLQHGANINRPADRGIKRTPLQFAAEIGDKKMVEYLISQEANVNDTPTIYRGGTALQLASGGGYYGVAEVLIKNDAIINAPRGRFQGRTALEAAAEHGRLDVLALLVREGADLTSSVYGEEQYQRALAFARRNHQEPARRLLESLHQLAMNARSEVTDWPAMEPHFQGLT